MAEEIVAITCSQDPRQCIYTYTHTDRKFRPVRDKHPWSGGVFQHLGMKTGVMVASRINRSKASLVQRLVNGKATEEEARPPQTSKRGSQDLLAGLHIRLVLRLRSAKVEPLGLMHQRIHVLGKLVSGLIRKA
ncbi:uncharacterized protein MCYG_00810 [Microsporum canis CBS 113480]|uniref:Uncharacterized protein n=1 Tax=Arthroderma otae (strain ATCC MYA-4605 / CBS 113480) TaxID=554155 RepID=C5FDE8_ARTOC|nr:uncharacterized protein MCYG_00810 [Microsporum canis CBS 113480]EEQ27922.1 predicted protein [Microsporum canis CBS 113480]